MTLIEPRPGQQRRSGIAWTAIQSGLWVGHADGEFAGMIEARWGHGFIATTRLARELGAFPTLEEAKAAFREG